ncbi:MAG: hypothetical protein WKF87_10145 [Chryseolinea sp.]
MLIRKNTKPFKAVKEIITTCKDRADRKKLIRLYITKAGHSIKDRISVEGIQGDADLFYEINYDAIWNNLESSDRQLHQSDDDPGIYFFHNASNKQWDETPFEFDEAIREVFSSLAEIPTLRKKGKTEKYVFPVAAKTKPESKPGKLEKAPTPRAVMFVHKGPKQPDYKLKHNIEFSNLDKVVFRKAQLSKKDVLDYYNNIAENILPYLKDRPLSVGIPSKGRTVEYNSFGALADVIELPDWIQGSKDSASKEQALYCNDKEHLLWYVEIDAVEFKCGHSRKKLTEHPDYIVIEIESPDIEPGKAINVALAANEIFSGLRLPAFIKSDGHSGLHVYIPLDSKSTFEAGEAVAAYVCKLIRVKVPDLVTMEGSDDNSYGKVSLRYMVNRQEKKIVAPYSLVVGESPTIAAPLRWEELVKGLQLQDLNHQTIFKRLKQLGDPLDSIFKKKVNADGVLERMQDNYSFLFGSALNT